LSLGDRSPLFYYPKLGMIDKNDIENIVNEYIEGKGVFLVSVKVSSANRISVFVDTDKGITLEECVELHRHIEKNLDRDQEDFELQVSSPGLDMPFMVLEQYRKNIGKNVEVVNKEGEKFSGTLKNITEGGFELDTEVRIKGKKKESRELSFNFDEIKMTKEILKIK